MRCFANRRRVEPPSRNLTSSRRVRYLRIRLLVDSTTCLRRNTGADAVLVRSGAVSGRKGLGKAAYGPVRQVHHLLSERRSLFDGARTFQTPRMPPRSAQKCTAA